LIIVGVPRLPDQGLDATSSAVSLGDRMIVLFLFLVSLLTTLEQMTSRKHSERTPLDMGDHSVSHQKNGRDLLIKIRADRIIRGVDRSEGTSSSSRLPWLPSVQDRNLYLVKEKPPNTKSMAASKNLATPVTMSCEGPTGFEFMAAELTLRLNDARETSPNLWPRTIALSTRQGGRVLAASILSCFNG